MKLLFRNTLLAKIGLYIGRVKNQLIWNTTIITVMQIGASNYQNQPNSTPVLYAGVKLELSDNLGAMKTVSNMSNSNFTLQEIEEVKLELSDNLGVGRIASGVLVSKPNQTKTNKMSTNNTAAVTVTEIAKPARVKANYDVVRGNVIKELTAKPGMTLNELNAALGKGTETNYNFPVIYAAVGQLRKGEKAAIFGTGAKKNEGLYLTAADALKNKPEPRAAATNKASQVYVLEKLITMGTKKEDDKWKVIEGNSELGPIKSAFDAASMVPGTVFRIGHNEGDEHKIIETGTITKAMRKAQPEPAAEAPAEAQVEPAVA